jgi:hypothetical protein
LDGSSQAQTFRALFALLFNLHGSVWKKKKKKKKEEEEEEEENRSFCLEDYAQICL